MRKHRIGIIGLGDIAQKAYLPILTQHAQAEIVGIMARTTATINQIGDRYRIKGRYTQLEELLDQELEAVFVHTPTETHEAIVMSCLQRGMDVYVDKPLSYDIAASIRMAEAAAEANRLLAVGFNRRFAPMYKKAKAWIQETGTLDLTIAQKHRTKLQHWSAKETLYDDFIHMADLSLWLNSSDYKLDSYTQLIDTDGKLVHGTGFIRFEAATACLSMNRRAGADIEKVELHGGGRSAEIIDMDRILLHDQAHGQHTERFGSWDTIGERRGFTGIIDHFLASIDDHEQCTIRADQVLASHRLIDELVRVNSHN